MRARGSSTRHSGNAFLQAGGMGISDGDGNLTYGPEMTFETYYDFAIAKNLRFAFDYQFFANLSFNREPRPGQCLPDKTPLGVLARIIHVGLGFTINDISTGHRANCTKSSFADLDQKSGV